MSCRATRMGGLRSSGLALLALTALLSLLRPSSAESKPVHVLAFGDSLTQGFTERVCCPYPYTLRLSELLAQRSAANHVPAPQVDNRGISGDRAVRMVDRLQRTLANATSRGVRYDYVLLLAGINDIGRGATAEQVVDALRAMYGMCAAHGARTVAMTLLPVNATRYLEAETLARRREAINRDVRRTVEGSPRSSRLYLLDLAQLLQPRAAELLDDGLHLSRAGYDVMAEMLFNKIVEIEEAHGSSSSSSSSSSSTATAGAGSAGPIALMTPASDSVSDAAGSGRVISPGGTAGGKGGTSSSSGGSSSTAVYDSSFASKQGAFRGALAGLAYVIHTFLSLMLLAFSILPLVFSVSAIIAIVTVIGLLPFILAPLPGSAGRDARRASRP